MHVGRGQLDIAQARRFEIIISGRTKPGHRGVQTDILGRSIINLGIGLVALVTAHGLDRRQTGLGQVCGIDRLEQRHAVQLLRGQQTNKIRRVGVGIIADHGRIEIGLGTYHGALELSQGHANTFRRHLVITKRGLEQRWVEGQVFNRGHDIGQGIAHLDRRLDGPQRLLFQTGRALVPEHIATAVETHIGNVRCIAVRDLAVKPARELARFAKAERLYVAA